MSRPFVTVATSQFGQQLLDERALARPRRPDHAQDGPAFGPHEGSGPIR
jgi:hypothetical protein